MEDSMFVIEGSERPGGQSNYCADGAYPPYAVFDIERQRWIVAGLRWRWLAVVAKWFLS
jgi:hypothetical protein